MFEFLRKKTVEIDLPDSDGKIRTVSMSQNKFDALAKAGRITRVLFVNVLDCPAKTGSDILRNPRMAHQQKITWQWKIGQDIDLATYNKLKDPDGNLHAMTVWREGEKKVFIVTKAQYEEGCRISDL